MNLVLWGVGVCLCALVFVHCTPILNPPSSSIACVDELDCPSEQRCVAQLCVHLNTAGGLVFAQRDREGKWPDDDDDTEAPKIERSREISSYRSDGGRAADARPGPIRTPDQHPVDWHSGRGEVLRPDAPILQRPPDRALPKDDTDDSGSAKVTCSQEGRKRMCYPARTSGCFVQLKICFGRCAFGQQTCIRGQWSRCKGMITPTQKHPCQKKVTDPNCPSGKASPNGRCLP